mgnify:CR=1 FL=1
MSSRDVPSAVSVYQSDAVIHSPELTTRNLSFCAVTSAKSTSPNRRLNTDTFSRPVLLVALIGFSA